MTESRGSDSNVELNDTRSNQTSSPMYSSSPKKREEGIRLRAQEMGRFPRSVNGETIASQWISQRSSLMEN
jgi:hypothetical protein